MLTFWASSVGKKLIMAATGLLMVFFVLAHVLGNLTIYFGWINTYADHLHALPALVWIFRLFMLSMLGLHVFLGIQLTWENRSARGEPYAMKATRRTTFAAKNMIWTGAVIGAFLVYHLLHFTVQVIQPEFAARTSLDAAGQPDVFRMLVLNFQSFPMSGLYVLAMIALLLHLTHGIQSFFQTFGLTTDSSLPVTQKAGTVVAALLFIGYISVPIVILIGLLNM